MTRTFIIAENSTIFDTCLNTYGTLDLLVKLMDDNSHAGVDVLPTAGAEYTYDSTLVKSNLNSFNGSISDAIFVGQKYATAE